MPAKVNLGWESSRDASRTFVEVHVENSPTTFLRRPISVNYVDKSKNELWLLIQLVGDGTRKMAEFRPGDIVNIMLPLGNSFTIPSKEQENKDFC